MPVEPLLAGLEAAQPRTRLEAAVALARLGKTEHAAAILPLVSDEDSVIAHTAVQALSRLKAADACFSIVDRADAAPTAHSGALRVLQGLHEPAVVDGLITRLDNETDVARRQGLLIALCRLYNHEGTWTGTSWGTRPDTRGPYYQPEPWASSEKISTVLKRVLDGAAAGEASFLLAQLNRHRVRLDGTLDRLLAMAAKDPALHAAAVNELALGDRVPAAALPLLQGLARAADTPVDVRSQTLIALLKSDDPVAFQAVLAAVTPLSGKLAASEATLRARNAFLNPGTLGRHAEPLCEQAEKLDGSPSVWAEGGLLLLAAGKNTSPEVRALANKSIDAGWAQPRRRVQILQAALLANDRSYEGKALAAVNESDAKVAEAARKIVSTWKLEKRTKPLGPLVQSLKPEEVIAQVVKHPGDPARGEQLFIRLNCAKCHTVNPNEPQRGPFLPQVAKIYKPDQIAESLLLPSKSIAQGFVTNLFVLDDGKTITGFVTGEAADEITLRDAEGREIKIATAHIEERSKQTVSIMPEGLVKDLSVEEFSALVAYVDSLADKAVK